MTNTTNLPSWIQDEVTAEIYTNWHADQLVTFDRMLAFGDREPDEEGAVWRVQDVLDYLKGTGFSLEGCTVNSEMGIVRKDGLVVIEVV